MARCSRPPAFCLALTLAVVAAGFVRCSSSEVGAELKQREALCRESLEVRKGRIRELEALLAEREGSAEFEAQLTQQLERATSAHGVTQLALEACESRIKENSCGTWQVSNGSEAEGQGLEDRDCEKRVVELNSRLKQEEEKAAAAVKGQGKSDSFNKRLKDKLRSFEEKAIAATRLQKTEEAKIRELEASLKEHQDKATNMWLEHAISEVKVKDLESQVHSHRVNVTLAEAEWSDARIKELEAQVRQLQDKGTTAEPEHAKAEVSEQHARDLEWSEARTKVLEHRVRQLQQEAKDRGAANAEPRIKEWEAQARQLEDRAKTAERRHARSGASVSELETQATSGRHGMNMIILFFSFWVAQAVTFCFGMRFQGWIEPWTKSLEARL